MSQTALTSTQKTEDRPISLNHNLKLKTVGVLSDTASALLGGLRYVSGSFDTFTNALSFYISPPWRRAPSEGTQRQEQACQATAHKGAPDPMKHQGAGSQEGNYRWIQSGQRPVQQTRKKHQVPAQDLRGESSVPSVTLAENSLSNLPLPDTCQWHLITSVLPSASLLRHLDWLPSHRWLCWTNLQSPWPYVASPMGTWHKKTSLTVHLLWLIAHTWAILCKSLTDVVNWL